MDGGSLVTFVLRSLFMPLSSSQWWFVAVYVFLLLLSPTVNRFLEKLNRKGFLLFLLIGWAVWYGLAGIIGTEFFALQKAVFFYAMGAYVRIFAFGRKKSRRMGRPCLSGLGRLGVLLLSEGEPQQRGSCSRCGPAPARL